MWILPKDYKPFDENACSISFVEATIIKPNKDFYYPLHTHEWFEIVFCVNGTGQVTIHTTTINIKKGMAIIVKPNTFHSFYSENGSDFTYCVLSFLDNPESPISKMFSSSENILTNFGDNTGYVLHCFELLKEQICNGTSNSAPFFYSTCVQLLFFMDFYIKTSPALLPVSENKKTEQILKYINDHYNEEDLCLESIAEHFFLSVSQISRLFKNCYNTSLINYLIDYRFCMAKDYLSNSNIEIKEICELVGYTNTSHFCRLFEKRVGLSPTEYRKQFTKYLPDTIPITMGKIRAMLANNLQNSP